jgi:putative oxidoreductase
MNIAYTLGRILLPIIFIAAGVQHVLNIQAFASLVEGSGIPIPDEIAAYLAGMPKYEVLGYLLAVIEIVCGLMILAGLKARWGALVLIVYSACAIFFIHHFWDMAAAQFTDHMDQALKHLSIMGGLLLLVGGGPTASDRAL